MAMIIPAARINLPDSTGKIIIDKPSAQMHYILVEINVNNLFVLVCAMTREIGLRFPAAARRMDA